MGTAAQAMRKAAASPFPDAAALHAPLLLCAQPVRQAAGIGPPPGYHCRV
ncbi:hypothetical protein BN940_06081 [Castellaniella defragrans 65Phen]|uniref:Uncharacterized protein n=1 Tax=Castellaniella defragrans (strain DSM 12143 / CCUG 39792 / 65Phen) TaxID=1437824 RepID=W8X8U5_CASD6|nr:hypothetical protein BN940_06081 [Castellaniella defragrans 65Phen]